MKSASKRNPRRSTPIARTKSKTVPLIFGAGVLLAIAIFFTVGLGSRTADSNAPVLGAHLHSLLAFGSKPTLLVGTHGASAITVDGGRSLTTVAQLSGLDAMESADSASGARLLVAGHDGAMESTDRGTTWQPYGTTLPGMDIHGLAADPRNGDHVFAYVAGTGIFRTVDGGRTWQETSSPPVEPMGTGIVNGRTVMLPTMGAGLIKSVDDGRTWTLFGGNIGGMTLVADPQSRSHLFLSGSGPLFVSTDSGATWQQKALPDGAQIAVPSGKSLFAAGYSNTKRALLWSSTDAGATWTPSNNG